jgi:DNA-binding NarL/FixJ family response regulator
MMSVLIVDDHPEFRQGLRQILEELCPNSDFAEAGNALEALACVVRRAWTLAILDIGMPDQNGIELLREMLRIRPEIRVVVLTVYPEDQYAARCLRAGAYGFLTKNNAHSELARALRTVLAGKKYAGSALAKKTAAPPLDLDRLHESLSQRELIVMLALASGRRLTDIAREMNLSIKTVSTYKRRILDKMNLRSNADLTRYAIEHGLI